MKKAHLIYIVSLAAVVLLGCTTDELPSCKQTLAVDARELTGIQARIEGDQGLTRAGTVTRLVDYVGRSKFVGNDRVMFTEIRRTTVPFDAFSYPGSGDYEGIAFDANSDGGWVRDVNDGGPERIYWTDAQSGHTFIAYSTPQNYGEYWKAYNFTQGEGDEAVKKTYYIGAIGNPTLAGIGHTTGDAAPDVIDFSLTEEEQAANYKKENNVDVYSNPKLEKEDVVIAYDEDMHAEPGGSVALVKFYHALSSVRVVVNISGFSAGSSAVADNATEVSNMYLLHQPTMYIWMQADPQTQPLRASREGATLTDQQIINAAWENGGSNLPPYNQRKDIKLWIPRPKGSGSNQRKTFTFYGITTPQPQDYMTTLKDAGDNDNTKAELKFTVTYPDPLKPTEMKDHVYTASLDDVYFRAGYNTTINISLNHKNEEMTVGAEYENWQFIATPDQGNLKKNSTFLQSTDHDGTIVTIADDAKATADDATWLYKNGDVLTDIYGHTGTSVADAYQISTAYQLVSFAHEVKSGRDFDGKFVRLDADITLQKKSDKTTLEDEEGKETAIDWIGIGDATHAFNGTFVGGNRYIYRLKGSPLFALLGENAKIEQLNVAAINTFDGSAAVAGGGLFAETNNGLICASRVLDDVSLSAETAGSFVNTNNGSLYCCYHIGTTIGTTNVGGLVGDNSSTGIISCCFQAGVVDGTTKRGVAYSSTGTIHHTYFNKSLFDYDHPSEGVSPKTTAEMTKQLFVNDLNDGIATWRAAHTGYDAHSFIYQPANYPRLSDTIGSGE